MLHRLDPFLCYFKKNKNECSHLRLLNPQNCTLSLTQVLMLCLQAGKLAFPLDCVCVFLISSEAASGHNELPLGAEQVISWVPIHNCCWTTLNRVESIVMLRKFSLLDSYLAGAPTLYLRGALTWSCIFVAQSCDILTASFFVCFDCLF